MDERFKYLDLYLKPSKCRSFSLGGEVGAEGTTSSLNGEDIETIETYPMKLVGTAIFWNRQIRLSFHALEEKIRKN